MTTPHKILLTCVSLFGALTISAQGQQTPNQFFSDPGQGNLLGIGYTEDGGTLLTSRSQDNIGLWDISKGEWETRIITGKIGLTAVSFHPKATVFAAGRTDNNVLIWDWKADKPKMVRGKKLTVSHLAFDPQSDLVAGSYADGSVLLWNPASTLPIRQWKAHEGPVSELVYGPDGSWLASLSASGEVAISDPKEGKVLHRIPSKKDQITALASGPDGKWLALASPNGKIRVLEFGTWKTLRQIKSPHPGLYSLATSPDGRWIAGSDQVGNVTVWNAETGEVTDRIKTIAEYLAFDPTQPTLATSSASGAVSVWALEATAPAELYVSMDMRGGDLEIVPLYSNRWKLSFSLRNPGDEDAKNVLVQTKVDPLNIDTTFLVAAIPARGQKTFSLNLPVESEDNRLPVHLTIQANSPGVMAMKYEDDLVLDNIESSRKEEGKYYALIIGIDEYSGDWKPLNNAVKDAQGVADELKSNYQFDEFITLYNEDASREGIIEKFEWLGKNLTASDNLFIYYGGHGEFKENIGSGFWVPADALEKSTAQYISNSDIQNYIKGINAKHTLLVADACYMGDLFRGETAALEMEPVDPLALPRYFKMYDSKQSRQAITSGGIEQVKDGGANGHSVFAHYLIETLSKNERPYLLAGQLFQQLEIPVVNNSYQTPQYHALARTGDEGGQFLFIRKSTNP